MSSPIKQIEEATSSTDVIKNGTASNNGDNVLNAVHRPPAKRRLSNIVIEISDTESDDSDVCAVNSYQATADEVKRIRGDYSSTSSSSSSSSDYSSDSESPCEDDSIVLDSERVQINPNVNAKASLLPRANRMDDPKLNSKIKCKEVLDKLTTHWKEVNAYTSDDVTLISDPFRVCVIKNFLENVEIINNIVDDMNTLDWFRKKMDLFEFHQTADLASLTWQRSIRGIYELLKTEVMSWVSTATGVPLTAVSASCSLYGPGDHLLVHDDLLGDRRVAFILYLSPWARAWGARAGGALQLVGRDAHARPLRPVQHLHVANNMFVFFKVGHDSYHQVSEVVSLEVPRLSINGWYHGPPLEPAPEPPPAPPPPPEPLLYTNINNDVVVLSEWLEPAYMGARARAQLATQMEAASELSLRRLLLPRRYRQLLDHLQDPATQWEAAGPLDQRRHEVLAGGGGGGGGEGAGAALLRLVGSAAWLRLLQELTGLPLQPRVARLQLQRWAAADYTLLPPASHYQQSRLECVLYVGGAGRGGGGGGGGSTVYVAPGEEGGEEGGEALVTVPPVPNSLSLVYCEPGTTSFTKYVSRLALRPGDRFYMCTATYTDGADVTPTHTHTGAGAGAGDEPA